MLPPSCVRHQVAGIMLAPINVVSGVHIAIEIEVTLQLVWLVDELADSLRLSRVRSGVADGRHVKVAAANGAAVVELPKARQEDRRRLHDLNDVSGVGRIAARHNKDGVAMNSAAGNSQA